MSPVILLHFRKWRFTTTSDCDHLSVHCYFGLVFNSSVLLSSTHFYSSFSEVTFSFDWGGTALFSPPMTTTIIEGMLTTTSVRPTHPSLDRVIRQFFSTVKFPYLVVHWLWWRTSRFTQPADYTQKERWWRGCKGKGSRPTRSERFPSSPPFYQPEYGWTYRRPS